MPEAQRFVLGIAYQAGPDPRIKRGVDGGRDWFDKADLEQAAWSYMRSGCPKINAFHVDGTEDCAEPVESFIWRWDDWDVGDGIVVKDGDWLLGAILSPRMWDLHKAGKINGLSPQGTARRLQVQKEGAVDLAKGSVDVADDEDEFTRLVDANVPTVALVEHGANGIPRFLISKQEGEVGIFDADFVRSLIAKAEPEPTLQETVTMTGSPAAIAEMIHRAAVRKAETVHSQTVAEALGTTDAVEKAKYDADDLKRMAANGQAMDNESYPIADREDLDRAIRAVGRGGADHDAIRRHIAARAKALGASSEIPDNWASDGSLKKGTGSMETDDIELTEVLAEPVIDAPGNPTTPGSPAWEAIDAATACKWTAVLARARAAIDVMAEREMLEAAAGDDGDAESAWDLQDACCAIDYAISVLAPFAVGEHAEAEMGADMLAAVGKAVTDAAQPLEVIEGLAPVRKAGRVLSSANEAAIRGAVESLQKVLASLPAAPAVEDAVTKTANEEPDMPTPTPSEDATATSGQQPAMGAAAADAKPVAGQAVTDMTKAEEAPVEKAGPKPDQMAVYDSDGNLVGVVDPADVTRLMSAKAPAADTGTDVGTGNGAADSDGAMAEVQPTDDGTTPTDLAPAPADAVGTPADATTADDDGNVAKAETPDVPTNDMLKSSIDALVKAALDERSAEQAELYKGLETRAKELEEQNKALTEALTKQAASYEERLNTLENAPAVMAIASNGAVPPQHLLRGQDRGGQPDLSHAELLKAKFNSSDDAREKKAIADEMQTLAIEKFAAMQRRQ